MTPADMLACLLILVFALLVVVTVAKELREDKTEAKQLEDYGIGATFVPACHAGTGCMRSANCGDHSCPGHPGKKVSIK